VGRVGKGEGVRSGVESEREREGKGIRVGGWTGGAEEATENRGGGLREKALGRRGGREGGRRRRGVKERKRRGERGGGGEEEMERESEGLDERGGVESSRDGDGKEAGTGRRGVVR